MAQIENGTALAVFSSTISYSLYQKPQMTSPIWSVAYAFNNRKINEEHLHGNDATLSGARFRNGDAARELRAC